MIKFNKGEKREFIRLSISGVLFVTLFILDHVVALYTVTSISWWFPFILYFSLFIFIGYDVLIKAIKGLFNGLVFDENLLMTIASLSAFVLSIIKGINGLSPSELGEGVAVLLFYQVGEFFTSYSLNRSRKNIQDVLSLRPDFARIIKDGVELKLSPQDITVGEVIIVYPGEKIPLDGKIVDGSSSIDVSSLTGESVPVDLTIEDEVLSGSVCLSGQLSILVTKPFENSTVSKILDLIENATDKKSKTERFITRFAHYYTPIVVISALLVAIIPSLITGLWSEWVYRALSFLVVSCPCALVISIPLSYFLSLSTLSKNGILIKGSNYLEILSKTKTFIFDKTGTLTEGRFDIVEVYPYDKKEEILKLCCIAEHNSTHPIAKSIISQSNVSYDTSYNHTLFGGLGVIATKDGEEIICGNLQFLKSRGILLTEVNTIHTVVYVAKNSEFVGFITLKDKIKDSSYKFLDYLNKLGYKSHLLSGDKEEIVKEVSKSLEISSFSSSLLPHQKVEEVSKIINNSDTPVCFIGDGVNDAPSLTYSSVGVSMGIKGSDLTVECSDVVLMKDDLLDLKKVLIASKKTKNITTQNIVFSLITKFSILLLSVLGIANLWLSIFGDVGVLILAILNSLRCKKL